MIKRYVSIGAQQVHVHRLAAVAPRHHPLVCLHPIPYSGIFFNSIAPLLNAERDIIAPDYPGYGGSDPLAVPASIEGYADVLLSALSELNVSTCDLLGFHTGTLVGPEMALQSPSRIGTLILVDIPYFTPEEQAELLPNVVTGARVSPELSSLEKAWAFNVSTRVDYLSLERAFELFVEQLRAGDRAEDGFRAAFTYPCVERFAKLSHATRVIATQSMLLDATRAAFKGLPKATLKEHLEVNKAAFELGRGKRWRKQFFLN